jgi:hypothetical protein
MNSGNSQFERDFEAFLGDEDSRIATLYRKLPATEPDARLDSAVHALAQRAAAQPRTHARTRARWLPVSAATAVVLIAAGIVLRIAPQMQQRPAALQETAPSATLQSTPAAKMESAPAAKTQSEPAPTPSSPAPATPAPPPAAAPELRKSEAAPKPAPRAFPAPVATMREAAPAATTDAKSAAPAAAAPMRMKRAMTDSAGAQTLAAPTGQDGNASLYPEHWLANIRQMLRDNQREEALRSLAEFRKRYPDYRLPDDLRDLR